MADLGDAGDSLLRDFAIHQMLLLTRTELPHYSHGSVISQFPYCSTALIFMLLILKMH